MSRIVSFAAAFGLLTLACSSRTPQTNASQAPAPTAGPEPQAFAACGPTGLRFEHLLWVPANAIAIAKIELDDSRLDAALQDISTTSLDAPIDIAFAVKQWTWQIPFLSRLLLEAGFKPAELVYVRTRLGSIWIFRSQCDLLEAQQRVRDIWDLSSRHLIEGVVATPRDPDHPTFPFDVVFLPGERVAITSMGRSTDALQWSDTPKDPAPSGETAVDRMSKLDAHAPIRLVIRNEGLLAEGTSAGEKIYFEYTFGD